MEKNILILASGGGTTAEYFVRQCQENKLPFSFIVIYNNKSAGVAARMKALGVESIHLSVTLMGNQMSFDQTLLEIIKKRNIHLVACLGYMKLITKFVLENAGVKFVNTHPGLIEKGYGGEGMYGDNVHKKVYLDWSAGKIKQTGVTIHYLNERYDEGPIIDSVTLNLTDPHDADNIKEQVMAIEKPFVYQTFIKLPELTTA